MSKKRSGITPRAKKDYRHTGPLFIVDYSQQETEYVPRYKTAARKKPRFVLPSFEEACNLMNINLPMNQIRKANGA